MTITPGTATTFATGGATSITINTPAGLDPGDIVLAYLSGGGGTGQTLTLPDGFKELLLRVDQSTNFFGAVYLHRVTGKPEPASYTFQTSPSAGWSGVLVPFSGVDVQNVIDAIAGQANVSSANVTAPSVTNTATNAMEVFLGSVFAAANFTMPGGGVWTEMLDTNSIIVAYKQLSAVGASGSITATATAAGANAAFNVTLSPDPVYEQEGFRSRNDDGSETTATWRQAQDVDDSAAPLELIRLRFIVNTTENPPPEPYRLEVKKSGGNWRTVK